jgi:acyl-coenzyme A thioesterase PaaI-like protein
VLSVEFKVNFLNPARGERFRAEGRVAKSGRTISVCEGKLFALQNGQGKLVAMMQATMICIRKDS